MYWILHINLGGCSWSVPIYISIGPRTLSTNVLLRAFINININSWVLGQPWLLDSAHRIDQTARGILELGSRISVLCFYAKELKQFQKSCQTGYALRNWCSGLKLLCETHLFSGSTKWSTSSWSLQLEVWITYICVLTESCSLKEQVCEAHEKVFEQVDWSGTRHVKGNGNSVLGTSCA